MDPADDAYPEPVRLSGASRDGHLSIRGGSGGIGVQLEELTAGAEKLETLAGDLAAVEQEAGRILDQLCWADRQPPWSASGHIAAVRDGQWRVQASRAELHRISSQVRACMRDYQDAEWRANVGRTLGIAAMTETGLSWGTMAATGVPDRRVTENVIAMMQLAAPQVQAVNEHVPLVRDALMALVATFIPRQITLRKQEAVQVDLDTSPAGLLERLQEVEARGAGALEVLEVDNGGEKAYVVIVPGTQAAGRDAGGDNPFDEAGIVESMLYNSREVNEAVLAALDEAGAEKGAPVVAVGYSQGGIHAMNMAADPRVLEQYDVKYVLTAGSPVAGIKTREEVESLHLEHQADWVPGSDGAANPETRNRVTVSVDTPIAPGGDKGLGPGHRLGGYQDAARLVAASNDPSLVHSTAVLGAVLGAGGAATATRYSLTRAKGPSTTLAPPDPRAHERHLGGR
ncbi:hypothetical protein OVA06_18800 [Pseudarthrobacter sp. SL88]|uniref:hypothetical protein n=1 Tax=Pseudarthrobacter sp. SL88 TaxID=2994666 RepID=UPI00227312FE|nr:hypothetical protein [Pseudarthrobacter sp. SL88]MCY1676724.1 hypothetical protein [Pseudarthrobacter sp. SL88]